MISIHSGKTAEKRSSFRWLWAWHILSRSWPRVRFRRFYPADIVRKKVMNKKVLQIIPHFSTISTLKE